MPTLAFHDHVAYTQGLKMIEFLYGDTMMHAGIQQVSLSDIEPVIGHGKPTHEWDINVVWEGDDEPTWYILRAWAGERYTTWKLWQDTYPDMLMSIKLRARH